MPTLEGKPFNSYFKNILTVDQSTNTGIDNIERSIQDGAGNSSCTKISNDSLLIQPQDDDTVQVLLVKDAGGSVLFAVDSTNKSVKVGTSQTHAATLFKEMGLYQFSPASAGYHYPLIANRVGMQGAEALTSDNDWGNGTDPTTSLDVSGLTDPENAIAVYWVLEADITLDAVRYMVTSDDTVTINMHLFVYDVDSVGDLSNGAVHANATHASSNCLSNHL